LRGIERLGKKGLQNETWEPARSMDQQGGCKLLSAFLSLSARGSLIKKKKVGRGGVHLVHRDKGHEQRSLGSARFRRTFVFQRYRGSFKKGKMVIGGMKAHEDKG